MRTAVTGTALAIAALIVAGVVGVASAETTPSSSPAASVPARTISVDGVAKVPLAQGASAATATAAYRQAMAAAETDAHEKAEFLATKAGTGLGAVQNIAEEGGSISCAGGQEDEYVEYQGEQPDFGQPSGSPYPLRAAAKGVVGVAKPQAQRHRKRGHKRKKRTRAKAAVAASGGAATSCTLSAQVVLVYLLG